MTPRCFPRLHQNTPPTEFNQRVPQDGANASLSERRAVIPRSLRSLSGRSL